MQTNQSNKKCDIAAWLLMAFAMLFVLKVNLLPAVLSGLLVFELIHFISPYIAKHIPGRVSKWIAVAFIASMVIGLLVLLGMGIASLVRSDSGGFATLINQMAAIIEDSRKILPPWINNHLPADADALKNLVTEWLRLHSAEWQLLGKEAGHHIVHMLIAMVIGAMLALHDMDADDDYQPLALSLVNRVLLFALAFKNVVFAQIKISAINATFTAIYLAIVLPAMGIHLPFVKSMIVITFLVGLLPVVGNLISNTVIVVVSMSHSFVVAMGSLLFLVVIHKLEYFLNARIIGGQIRAHAWELLLAMLAMEATFGLLGLVAAPVYYAYIKSELRLKALI